MERRAIAIEGVVQGVGFRPYVYGLAARFALAGFVKNRSGGVLIEVEGPTSALERFLVELSTILPPLAHIESVRWETQSPQGDRQFRIESSEADQSASIFISPDIATCADCLEELLDPKDRRYRYPFLNCTNCGPRLTIITGAPYDRPLTSMASFAMCSACRHEYEDPSNRRFHAQPTCCPECGPKLLGSDGHGHASVAGDALTQFAAAVRSGQIGAMKGLGGYHLVCDARNDAAVGALRCRKHRDEKPFAIMVSDLAAAQAICKVSSTEAELLQSASRPIVLLRRRPTTSIVEAVAPRNPQLGVMLPYTPIHHLLLREMQGAPLVMTSGNRSDEPIAYEDKDATERLAGIADVFLAHDRPIQVRCDDSVVRVVDGVELPLRRSRGYAPFPITLPLPCAVPTLATGGQFKGTFALARGQHAFLSHHLGDLDHFAAYQAFVKDIDLYERLLDIHPALIAYDSHPDYASSRYARKRVEEGTDFAAHEVGLLPVQHHHAHIASCMAEHGLHESVIGVAFDGSGYGTDGAIWGGEFLVTDFQGFNRAAHLRYVGMPGGDQAVREPWRMALAHMIDSGANLEDLEQRVPTVALRAARRMLERNFNAPLTSSMGRLFDAVAALAGIRDRVSFEGQAAMELEWLAILETPESYYPFELIDGTDQTNWGKAWNIDTRPLIRAVARDASQGVSCARIARRFQSTIVELIACVCQRLRNATRIDAVALSGGVFMNGLLTSEASRRLTDLGFRVYRHRKVPPNDGGLSLGQLAIAAQAVAN
jgi:hydrogenase maturation protein HypF